MRLDAPYSIEQYGHDHEYEESCIRHIACGELLVQNVPQPLGSTNPPQLVHVHFR